MSEYVLEFHPEFFSDMKKLGSKSDIEFVYKQVNKIKDDPSRFKHLRGEGNCYRIRIGNLRVIYTIVGQTILFLTVDKRDGAYSTYPKRLYSVRDRIR